VEFTSNFGSVASDLGFVGKVTSEVWLVCLRQGAFECPDGHIGPLMGLVIINADENLGFCVLLMTT
jgi:hypothetical protein